MDPVSLFLVLVIPDDPDNLRRQKQNTEGIDPKHTSYPDITHWPDRIPINQNSEKTENQE